MKIMGKKLWLPAVTLLIIALGVLLLTGAISCTQSAQTGETVLKPAETPSDAENPSNAQTAAVLEKRDIPALPSEYRVTGIGTKPHEDQISFEQAASIAVDLWSKVFKDKFKPEDANVFVTNSGTGKGVNRSYEVCSGSRFIGGAAYICILDSITGQPICVQKQAPFDQQVVEEDPGSANEDMMTAAMNDPKYEKIIETFISETFANGRSITNINQGSVGWDFYQPDVNLIVGCTVQMSEGECYEVFVASPSDEVVQVDFFPLGWISCYYGYYYAESAKDFPDHEVKGQLPDMNE